ncbi:hypothetical protein LZ31DRAFT_625036 [Colletotrichum somersetense]|nr:hypothetical protein LZ31DRAFT_625036 [Colletotrichum somersetense]
MFASKEAIKARQQEEEQRREMEEGVQLRKKQAQDSATGEQVWYSRRVEDGCQIHWAVITHGNKYALRLPNGIPSREKLPDSTYEAPREYEAQVVPWSLKEETNRLRTLELTSPPGKGRTRDYTVCQIGWTTLTKDQVNAEWEAARKALAADALGFDDCRNLLKKFSRIIKKPDGCALDYDWFAESLEIPSHRLHEITPEKAVKSFQHMIQNGAWLLAGAGAGAGIVYGAYKTEGPMASIAMGSGNPGPVAGSVDGVCAACWCCAGCANCDWSSCFTCAGAC